MPASLQYLQKADGIAYQEQELSAKGQSSAALPFHYISRALSTSRLFLVFVIVPCSHIYLL
jgi:hypothetical protein